MRPVLLVAALLTLLIATAAAEEESKGGLTDEDRSEIEWLAKNGRMEMGDGLPLVQVLQPAAAGTQEAAWDPFAVTGLGFLKAEDEKAWTVVGGAASPLVLPKRPEDGARPWKVEILDAVTFGRAYLGTRTSEPIKAVGLVRWFAGVRPLGVCTEVVLTARALAVRGEAALARDVLLAGREHLRTAEYDDKPATLLEGVVQEEALRAIWLLKLRFDDGAIPRTALRADLVEFLRRFADSKHAAEARDMLRILERMLREDAEHRPIDDAALQALAPEEQAREWVWRLRDQDGGQWMQPGGPSVFTFGEDSPAHRLRALGHHAVPVLIETLTDERFTRTVGYWRDFHYSHYVVRYAEAAREILHRITWFDPSRVTCTKASMLKDGEAAQVQRAYRAWWAEVGVFDVPLRRLMAAPPDALTAAARALPDRDPGWLMSLDSPSRWGEGKAWEDLGVGRERAVELSTAVLHHSEHVRLRVAAAWMLHDLGAPGGVDAMVDLWTRLDETDRLDPARGEHVAAFLAACGDPRAVRALAVGLDQRSPRERQLIVHAFADSGLGAVRGLSADGRGVTEPWHLTGEAGRLAMDLLVGRLVDLEVDPLRRIGRQDPLADIDPDYDGGQRIADLAVRVLAKRWPLRFRMEDLPALPASRWEELRKEFLALPRQPGVPR